MSNVMPHTDSALSHLLVDKRYHLKWYHRISPLMSASKRAHLPYLVDAKEPNSELIVFIFQTSFFYNIEDVLGPSNP